MKKTIGGLQGRLRIFGGIVKLLKKAFRSLVGLLKIGFNKG
jgi:hypothetical protein